MEEKKTKQVYSYHTFLFSFIWKTDKEADGKKKR